MAKKIVCGIIEAVYCVLYALFTASAFNSIGRDLNHAMERIASNDWGDKVSYHIFNGDLASKFKVDGVLLSISTIILIILSIVLYHIAFTKKES